MIKYTTPITEVDIKQMRAGDFVYISGVIYTGRDQAHRKMVKQLKTKRRYHSI